MFDAGLHATLVPGDPARTCALAFWSDRRTDTDTRIDTDTTTDSDHLVELTLPGPDGLATRLVPAAVVPIGAALDQLLDVPVDDPTASTSVRAWALVARNALDVIARGRLQPSVSPAGFDTWTLTPLQPHDHQVRAALAAWLPGVAHCHPAGADPSGVPVVPTADQAVDLFSRAVADALVRTAAAPTVARQPAWCGNDPVDVAGVRNHLPAEDDPARTIVGLRVLPPESDDDPVQVTLQVRSATDPSLMADAADLWDGTAAGFGSSAEADLLLALRRGARLWPPLAALLQDPRPTGMQVDDADASALFGPLASDLAGAGIEVLVPAALTRTVTATAHAAPPPVDADRTPSFDLATVCELTWRATLDGEPLSDGELSALAASRRPLVRLRGGWVVVDPTVATKLARRGQLSGADALAAALGGTVSVDGEEVQVVVAPAISDLADRLRSANGPRELPEPPGLTATLRPYQRRGLAWLDDMTSLGLGGVLADDMGLGKTIQLIAVHLQRAPVADGPTLVICPASLVGNWQRELARFAPELDVHRYHGADRHLDDIGRRDVVITTYGIVRRDATELAEQHWDLVVADEAQQVKNPNSATARALRSIPATARVAMTGTPVENRLSELWALLDWTTPGLLGPLETFRRTVAVPVERDRDPVSTERFTRLVSPFLLRRRKDDPQIAPDLPPKTETDHPVRLTVEQAALYRATVEEILETIAGAEGIARRGLVLKLLTALKQICNHPAHYLQQPGPLAGRSGKLDVAEELLTAITDAGDATLVFTQYVAMGNLLSTRLAELGIPSEFLHGSQTLSRRSDMVDRFQDGGFPVMVVSLKAGGTGLNLTRATHVIHYDRWWNPAVENQASDRIWRIGQDRPVQIHRLISEGTVEDRIAAVLAQKQALADAVVGGGEAWLTELDDTELAALVRLGEDGL